jgi:hypothetical protein
MNNCLKQGIVSMAAWLLLACGNKKADRGTTGSDTIKHAHEMQVKVSDTAAIAVVKDDQLNAVYKQYMDLTRALTAGDDRAAIIAGNALEAGARNMNEGKALATAAAGITAAPDLAARRVLFATLSNEMIARVTKAGLRTGALYVDFCPMALDDKGAYWLSTEKEVRNPYFGEQMINCGDIKDTIR